MKKTKILLLVIVFSFVYSCSKSEQKKEPDELIKEVLEQKTQDKPEDLATIKDGWERIYIKELGSIDFPPTMEVQSGDYKKNNDKYKKTVFDIEPSKVTLQQKGLNSFSKTAYEKYVRVLISTMKGEVNDFEKLNFDITKVSEYDMIELNIMSKNNILNILSKQNNAENLFSKQNNADSFSNIKMIEWYPVKLEKINGMSCIHISYKRQLNNNPIVFVNTYIFQNNDRMHDLTMSYRVEEEKNWKEDFELILKSFRITNIK